MRVNVYFKWYYWLKRHRTYGNYLAIGDLYDLK